MSKVQLCSARRIDNMLPRSGRGNKNIGTLPKASDGGEFPYQLYTIDETETQYHIASQLSQYGDVYTEVSCQDNGVIDLVWVQDWQGVNRTVGIEIKRADTSQTISKIIEQVQGYTDATAADGSDTDFVCGGNQDISRAAEVYLFDEVWLLLTGDKPLFDINSPSHGCLTYDWSSGILKYDIDKTPDRTTIDRQPSRTESWYTKQLWTNFAREGYWLSAEVKASRPSDRWLQDGKVITEKQKQTKKADLVVGDPATFDPVDEDTCIHAIEAKRSLKDTQRLNKQLDIYRNSGLFSHVSLAVPESRLTEAYELLKDRHQDVGLIYITRDGAVRSKSEQTPTRLELTKFPVVDTTNHNPSAEFLSM